MNVLAAIVLAAAASAPLPASGTCKTVPAFHYLDFWLGTWRVTEKGEYAGTDVVTAEVGGCAVVERWSEEGGSGISLFLYDRFADRWQQTWVTDSAMRVGGLKYKTMVARFASGGVRFQGLLPGSPAGTPILDRTTLTPLANGTVRQVIEQSRDGGETWKVGFDAVYTRADAKTP